MPLFGLLNRNQVEALVDAHKAAQLGVPLVRRFTGGGTVVVRLLLHIFVGWGMGCVVM